MAFPKSTILHLGITANMLWTVSKRVKHFIPNPCGVQVVLRPRHMRLLIRSANSRLYLRYNLFAGPLPAPTRTFTCSIALTEHSAKVLCIKSVARPLHRSFSATTIESSPAHGNLVFSVLRGIETCLQYILQSPERKHLTSQQQGKRRGMFQDDRFVESIEILPKCDKTQNAAISFCHKVGDRDAARVCTCCSFGETRMLLGC